MSSSTGIFVSHGSARNMARSSGLNSIISISIFAQIGQRESLNQSFLFFLWAFSHPFKIRFIEICCIDKNGEKMKVIGELFHHRWVPLWIASFPWLSASSISHIYSKCNLIASLSPLRAFLPHHRPCVLSEGFRIGDDELRIDDFLYRLLGHTSIDMVYIAIFEDSDDLKDRIHFANISEKFIFQAFTPYLPYEQSPAISTNSTAAGTILFEWIVFAERSKSLILVIDDQRVGSMVQKGKFAASAA